jgi:hypothetical protein
MIDTNFACIAAALALLLIPARASAQAPPSPPDSIRPDSIAADSVRARTLRADTAGSDTVRADTIRAAGTRVDSAPAPAVQAAPPARPPAPDRWRVVLDLAFSGSSGNQDLSVLTTGARLTRLVKEDFELEANTQLRYGRSEGEEVARNLRGGLKVVINPRARWSPFISTTFENDPFRKLDLRANGGAGAEFVLVKAPRTTMDVSMGALYSYEDYAGEPGSAALKRFQETALWSLRLRGQQKFQSGLQLEHNTQYQPRWNVGSDYNLTTDTSARIMLNDRIAFTLGFHFERDSTPRQGVERDDRLTRAGVTVQL